MNRENPAFYSLVLLGFAVSLVGLSATRCPAGNPDNIDVSQLSNNESEETSAVIQPTRTIS